eukprot:544743-Pyramimonas_sp.AAC.1
MVLAGQDTLKTGQKEIKDMQGTGLETLQLMQQTFAQQNAIFSQQGYSPQAPSPQMATSFSHSYMI